MNKAVQGLILVLGVVGVVLLAALAYPKEANSPLGSVNVANEYFSTSTGGAQINPPNENLTSQSGTFGSVVITGANTGELNFYNATTTDVNLRTGNRPTSSIYLASFPANTAAGTYVFDRYVDHGILLEIIGDPPTSTITFR